CMRGARGFAIAEAIKNIARLMRRSLNRIAAVSIALRKTTGQHRALSTREWISPPHRMASTRLLGIAIKDAQRMRHRVARYCSECGRGAAVDLRPRRRRAAAKLAYFPCRVSGVISTSASTAKARSPSAAARYGQRRDVVALSEGSPCRAPRAPYH